MKQDMVFVLSYNEAFDIYFNSDEERMCARTKYAEEQNSDNPSKYCIHTVNGRPASSWKLRCPSVDPVDGDSVTAKGTFLIPVSRIIIFPYEYIRPAIWVKWEYYEKEEVCLSNPNTTV